MSIEIRNMQPTDIMSWDAYVTRNRQATPYHLAGWQNVIESTYGHRTHFLLAIKNRNVVGILPLVHMKHPLFGNSMISLPFLDMAGVLADNQEVAGSLIHEALNLMHRVEADAVELRQGDDYSSGKGKQEQPERPLTRCRASGKRTRMVLDLPNDSDSLMRSFRSKLRNQIRKPMREGLEVRNGGAELLDDFYRVFTVNMRDLGSPVHSKEFLLNILEMFPTRTRIFVVYKGAQPVACSFICTFRKTVYNPWASSLRRHRASCPNMLLYWAMLEYACDQKFSCFDFGRSTEGEGTFRFKQQWGARPLRLCWYTFPNLSIPKPHAAASADTAGFQVAIQLWKRMPVPISRVVGPAIRKYIGL